jgi:hypothetical protein
MKNTPPPPVERKKIQEAIKEAETRALDFNPNARATFIREKVGTIELLRRKGLNERQLREHPDLTDFVEKYPELFKKIISGEDISMLRNMLNMLDKMGKGDITQHNASVAIGKQLASRYIHIKEDISGSQEAAAAEEENTIENNTQ